MAAEDGIPPWVTHLTGLITDFRKETNSRLDNLVTRDAFLAEQSRVNEKLDDQGKDIAELRESLAKESTARTSAELAAAQKAREAAEATQRTARATNWQWFLLLTTPFLGALAQWVLSGGLAR